MQDDPKFIVTVEKGHPPLFDGEPVFVFRGQDVFMPHVLKRYRSLLRENTDFSVPEALAHYEAVDKFVSEVIAWQEAHPDRVKNPD